MQTLSWFPRDVAQYLARTAFLSLEEEGALNRLEACAWDAPRRGDPVGTIPHNEAALERLLGPRWRQLLPFVHQHFVPHATRDDLLYSEAVAAQFDVQRARHERHANAGAQSGKIRRDRANNRRKDGAKRKGKPPRPNDLNMSQTTFEPGSSPARTSASNETPVGGSSYELPPTRGATTSPSPADDDAVAPPEASRLLTERPTRENLNAPPIPLDEEVLLAASWLARDPGAPAAVQAVLESEWVKADGRDSLDRDAWELAMRATARRLAYRAHSGTHAARPGSPSPPRLAEGDPRPLAPHAGGAEC